MVFKTRVLPTALDCLPLCSFSRILQTFILKLNVCSEIWIDPWNISLKKYCNEDKLINLKVKNNIFQTPYFLFYLHVHMYIYF